MPDSYLKTEFDQVIEGNERDEMLEGFKLSRFRIFDSTKYRVIYFFDDEEDYSENGGTFEKVIGNIFNILQKHFSEKEIARKYHPGYHSDDTIIETGDIIPDFIPAELLYDDNIKLYLGACSAAMSNVEQGLVVSILDLISFSNEQTREQLKEILLRTAHSKILFPRSLDEFEEILSNLPPNEKNSSQGRGKAHLKTKRKRTES